MPNAPVANMLVLKRLNKKELSNCKKQSLQASKLVKKHHNLIFFFSVYFAFYVNSKTEM